MCRITISAFNLRVAGYLGLSLILVLLLNSSLASEVDTPRTLAPVVVNGVSGSFQARYEDLLRGAETFAKKYSYAPGSKLRFFVRDASPEVAVRPLEIEFETKVSFYDVPMDEAMSFALPGPDLIDFKGSAMLANRKKGAVAVYPIVRTPVDGEDITHLGDLRLECEVSWAIQKGSVPFYIRSAFFAAGRVCHSNHISVSFYSPIPLVSATMRSGQRTEVFSAGRGRHSYKIPVYDRTWPDDTVVEFRYLNQ